MAAAQTTKDMATAAATAGRDPIASGSPLDALMSGVGG
jgi:hypothetical protein